jgi:hypothetical protein
MHRFFYMSSNRHAIYSLILKQNEVHLALQKSNNGNMSSCYIQCINLHSSVIHIPLPLLKTQAVQHNVFRFGSLVVGNIDIEVKGVASTASYQWPVSFSCEQKIYWNKIQQRNYVAKRRYIEIKSNRETM